MVQIFKDVADRIIAETGLDLSIDERAGAIRAIIEFSALPERFSELRQTHYRFYASSPDLRKQGMSKGYRAMYEVIRDEEIDVIAYAREALVIGKN